MSLVMSKCHIFGNHMSRFIFCYFYVKNFVLVPIIVSILTHSCRIEFPILINWTSPFQPFRSVEQSHLCNFGRGCYEEQFCKIILNLGQWFRRCCLKDCLSGALAYDVKQQNKIWSSGGPTVWWSGTIYVILKEGKIGNIHVKLIEI